MPMHRYIRAKWNFMNLRSYCKILHSTYSFNTILCFLIWFDNMLLKDCPVFLCVFNRLFSSFAFDFFQIYKLWPFRVTSLTYSKLSSKMVEPLVPLPYHACLTTPSQFWSCLLKHDQRRTHPKLYFLDRVFFFKA